jgi:hypothetical protein
MYRLLNSCLVKSFLPVALSDIHSLVRIATTVHYFSSLTEKVMSKLAMLTNIAAINIQSAATDDLLLKAIERERGKMDKNTWVLKFQAPVRIGYPAR